MKIFIEYLLLIVSIAFVIDSIFTGVIRKVFSPVNDVVINALAIVLVFNSAFDVIKEVAA
ncbi:hypothetical protein EAPG_04453 [Escherichia albertii B156]|nr:hypothetical protein EAPG_04453 [Escherichia albertii B156]